MTWWLWIGALAGTAAGLTAFGSKRWTDRVEASTRGLNAAAQDGPASPAYPSHYDERELEGLPAPVQRYFRAVLQDGQPVISAVTIEMAGTINLSASDEQWKPFTSRQRVVMHRPGFLWDARVSMLPGLDVRVIDSYIAGRGVLHAAVLGLFTVADAGGDGEMARGELMRFFAEAPWYPTALLPSQGVTWAAVDGTSANATIVDGPHTLTLLFRFNEAGLVDSVRAEGRGSMVGQAIVVMPWQCGLSDYQVRNGMTVPIRGEAAYVRAEGRKPYFVGAITSLNHEFARGR